MSKGQNPLEGVRADGPSHLAFLTAAGLTGPPLTDDGIVYRSKNQIAMSYVGPPEPEVSTSMRCVASTEPGAGARLACLHVACGSGVLQDVPGNPPNQTVAAKRITQHAATLRRVLSRLLPEDAIHLLRRCQGRELPLPQSVGGGAFAN